MTPDTPDAAAVTIVIVTFNSSETIDGTLRCARESFEQGLARCVVVDNQSEDGTASLVETNHPWAELVKAPGNLGFGRGCNLGFEHVETPYVLILNPDCSLPPRDLARLLEFAQQHPRAGIVAPANRSPTGRLHSHGPLPTPASVLRGLLPRGLEGPGLMDLVPGEPPFRVEWICGAVMLIESDSYRRLGGFDPRFFLYFEETDLLKRAHALGIEVWAVCESVACHIGGSSAETVGDTMVHGALARPYYQSRYYYLAKHHGRLTAWLTEAAELVLLALRSLVALVRRRPSPLRRRLRASAFRFPPPLA